MQTERHLTDWVTIVSNIGPNKLAWLVILLNTHNIPTNILKAGVSGPQLQVPATYAADALGFYYQNIGELIVGNETAITWADLDDGCEIFKSGWGDEVEQAPSIEIQPKSEFELTVNGIIGNDTESWLWKQVSNILSSKEINGQHYAMAEDVNSTQINRIGFRFDFSEKNDGTMAWFLCIGFNSGGLYRYNPLSRQEVRDLLLETYKTNREVVGASVGKLFHTLIKIPAERGEIKCEKKDGDTWKQIHPKVKKSN